MSHSDDAVKIDYNSLLHDSEESIPVTALEGHLIDFQLQDNTQFRYELQLALNEIKYLSKTKPELQWDFATIRLRHDRSICSTLLRRLAYYKTVEGELTDYHQLQSKNVTRHPNQYLTHWFYPYKGKFHPQLVRALLNILQVAPGETVLDPFNGSGTTVLESMLLGINAVGRDVSPVCVKVTRAKTQAWRHLQEIEQHSERFLKDVTFSSSKKSPVLFEDDSIVDFSEALADVRNEEARNFFVVARLIAESDAARRSREIVKSLQRQIPKMVRSCQFMQEAVTSLKLELGNVDIAEGDARKLDLRDNSIEHIITSPPYSIMLNYVENDKHALEALGHNIEEIQENFIGVRGKGKGKFLAYDEDMKLSLSEMERVLVPGGKCAIVIGNPVYQGEEVPVTDHIIKFAESSGLQLLENWPKYVLGFYNTLQTENILFFKKTGVKPERPL